MNISGACEHAAKIEQEVSVAKDLAWGIVNILTSYFSPDIIITKLIYFIVLWLDAFPAKYPFSVNFLPIEKLERQKLVFKKNFVVVFGSYRGINNELEP